MEKRIEKSVGFAKTVDELQHDKKLENTKIWHAFIQISEFAWPVSDLSLITDYAGKNETPPFSRDVIGEMWSLVKFLTQNCLCDIKDYLFWINL